MPISYETLKQLKSGTDIRGVAMDGVPGQTVDLTDEAVSMIATGFASWLETRTGKGRPVIAVGRDSRLSGPRIRDTLVEALISCGAEVLDCGLASTPAMFMTTIDLGCDGAVEITASHHPPNRNGLKFFTRDGGLDGGDIEGVLTAAAAPAAPKTRGECVASNYMERYAARLRGLICDGVDAPDHDRPLDGFRIVVDAGNGVGGFYATDVLAKLGADISGSQFLNPDGSFPNHAPNPEDKSAMASICHAVTASKADLGVIFDTDVDRAGCVGPSGREMGRNRLIAVASSIALEGNPGGTVVTDSITSSGLKEFIERTLGGKHNRYKRGYRNVINEAVRLNAGGVNCPLAIETSGHAAMRENYILDDGAYLATKIIIKAALMRLDGMMLEDLIADLSEPVESDEVRLNITGTDFRKIGEATLADLEAYALKMGWAVADDSREGVRISFGKDGGDGWMLLRLSVHDPVMPLNLESDTAGGNVVMAHALLGFLRGRGGLDLAALEHFAM